MLQKVLSLVRRCSEDYDMISPGDRIAVGLSGGKDSLVMLLALTAMRGFYPVPYEVAAVTVDVGVEGVDYTAVVDLCKNLNIEHKIVKTQIFEVVFGIRRETNPCALCAKMRRGVLHDAALELGCRKIALGHNRDDAVETLIMSQIYEGRISCFSPVTYLSRKDIRVIRPLLYVPEKIVRSCARGEGLPVTPNPCPANGHSKRQEIKELIRTLERTYPGLSKRLFGAMQRLPLADWEKNR